jgi:hypothetical protein
MVVDPQTLHENFLRHFKIVVEKADPGCIMAAYNRVNGLRCTQNPDLLTDVLRDQWGWTGFVVSDWWGAQPGAGADALNAGLDLEMPDNNSFSTHTSDLWLSVGATLAGDATSRRCVLDDGITAPRFHAGDTRGDCHARLGGCSLFGFRGIRQRAGDAGARGAARFRPPRRSAGWDLQGRSAAHERDLSHPPHGALLVHGAIRRQGSDARTQP